MYWLRTTSIVDPLLFIVISLCWMIGGWLLVTHSGRFLKRERPIAGLASGMLLYILLGNALAHWLFAYFAFACAAMMIFVIGVWAARKSKIHWSDLISLEIGFQLLALILIFGLFELILRGLGVGDDYPFSIGLYASGGGYSPSLFTHSRYISALPLCAGFVCRQHGPDRRIFSVERLGYQPSLHNLIDPRLQLAMDQTHNAQ